MTHYCEPKASGDCFVALDCIVQPFLILQLLDDKKLRTPKKFSKVKPKNLQHISMDGKLVKSQVILSTESCRGPMRLCDEGHKALKDVSLSY